MQTLIELVRELYEGAHGQSERRYIGELLNDVVFDYDAAERHDVALSVLDTLIDEAQGVKRAVRALGRSK